METAISIRDLVYNYPDGTLALNAVSLDIHRGESVALIGPNGSGKTTLLLHLNGVLQGKNGSVKILGEETRPRNLRDIRKKVGIVFQDPDDQLFMPTVFDDVAFGPLNIGYPKEEIRQRVKRALASVGMSAYEHRVPHHLSLGEKKRVAIAAVLSMEPEILAIDEPTANLDPQAKWELIELLQGLLITKIVASHDLEMVQALCSRTVILDEGRIVADGLTSHILADIALLQEHGLARSAAKRNVPTKLGRP